MSELDEIRRRKLEALQQKIQEQDKAEQQIHSLESFVLAHLNKDAFERYSNLKVAHPDKVIKILAILAQIIDQQNITNISDDQFKELLKLINGKKRETKINFR